MDEVKCVQCENIAVCRDCWLAGDHSPKQG